MIPIHFGHWFKIVGLMPLVQSSLGISTQVHHILTGGEAWNESAC